MGRRSRVRMACAANLVKARQCQEKVRKTEGIISGQKAEEGELGLPSQAISQSEADTCSSIPPLNETHRNPEPIAQCLKQQNIMEDIVTKVEEVNNHAPIMPAEQIMSCFNCGGIPKVEHWTHLFDTKLNVVCENCSNTLWSCTQGSDDAVTDTATQVNYYQCSLCPFRSQELGVVQQHITTCMAWSHDAVVQLIETYRHHMPGFSDVTKKKYEVWCEISNELQAKGYNFDSTACSQKMRSLKRRYEAIRGNDSLRGRDALKQWQFFNAMDDLLGQCKPVQSRIPVDSPSALAKSIATDVSEPAVCSTPGPAPSPKTTIPSPSPHGDSLIPPQPKIKQVVESPYAEEVKQQGRSIENLVSQNHNQRGLMEQPLNRLTTPASTHSEEKEELQKKISDLQQRLLKQREDLYRENRKMQQQHNKEIKELHLKYQNEIKEMQQKFIDMQQQHQQQLVELILRINKKAQSNRLK